MIILAVLFQLCSSLLTRASTEDNYSLIKLNLKTLIEFVWWEETIFRNSPFVHFIPFNYLPLLSVPIHHHY